MTDQIEFVRPSTPQPAFYIEAGRENRYDTELRQTKTYMDNKKEACCCLVREQDESSKEPVKHVECHCSEKVNGVSVQCHDQS